jgi:hypothetical protein
MPNGGLDVAERERGLCELEHRSGAAVDGGEQPPARRGVAAQQALDVRRSHDQLRSFCVHQRAVVSLERLR